jgi:HlyD family secretion protein
MHPRVLWSRIKVRWPLLVWLLALAAFAMLWRDLGVRLTFSGVLVTRSHPVATIEMARVAKVHVTTGQSVDAGDVLVELDRSVIEGEIEAEVLAQTIVNREYQVDRARAERDLQRARLEAEVSLRDLAITRAAEEAELTATLAELERAKPLAEANLVDPLTLARLRARAEALEKGLAQYPAAEKARQDYAAWATQALEAAAAEPAELARPEDAPAARALRARLPLFTLHAPVSGTITNLAFSAGEGVREGDIVLTLVENASNQIAGFLHEDMVQSVSLGQELWAFVDPQETEFFPVKVTALGPNVIDLPNQASLFPGRLIRGRPVLLDIQGPHNLLPGQRVTIRTAVPWWVRHLQPLLRK